MPIRGVISSHANPAEVGADMAAAKLGFRPSGFGLKDYYEDARDLNICLSDGTLLIGDFGAKAPVIALCQDRAKPYFVFRRWDQHAIAQELRLWIERNQIQVLNVVGLSSSGHAAPAVSAFLVKVLRKCQ